MLMIKQQYTQLCDSRETAINLLLVCINNDIKTIRVEEQYDPSVLTWSEDNVTLVHAPNYTTKFVDELRDKNTRCPKCGGILVSKFGPGITLTFCVEDNCDYEDYDYDL